MILDITQYGNPILRKKCKPVAEVTDELKEFGENLIDTMISAEGIGLAAPQVGLVHGQHLAMESAEDTSESEGEFSELRQLKGSIAYI